MSHHALQNLMSHQPRWALVVKLYNQTLKLTQVTSQVLVQFLLHLVERLAIYTILLSVKCHAFYFGSLVTMVDHLPVEIMTVIIIILIIERETVEERTPMQVIEVVDKWLEHP